MASSTIPEGRKLDAGKPRTDLLPTRPLLQIAEVLRHGADKYGEWNWRSGIAYSRVYGAVLRHLFAWADGENRDSESGLSHLAHAACGLLFLLEYAEGGPSLDDRYPRAQVKK